MSLNTAIQWSDDTINPIMGCSVACELRPTPGQLARVIEAFFQGKFPEQSVEDVDHSVAQALGELNTTEIFQCRLRIVKSFLTGLGIEVDPLERRSLSDAFEDYLKKYLICYAHQIHLRYSTDMERPEKNTNPGYAPQFEQVTKFPGRMAQAALWPDLFGKIRKGKPWLDYLPRVLFVSDMGDSLSQEIDFEYLETEIADVVTTSHGLRHIWLWLTKNPKRMAKFGEWLAGRNRSWPENVMAMTTVTGPETVWRAEALKDVPARFKGLSVEPLWGAVQLPLEGIDLCIVGGQSGHGSKPFDLSGASSLHQQCQASGTSFFVKQLGANAWHHGKQLILNHAHGGDWNEWPVEFRVRDMPQEFYTLRCATMF